MIELVVVCDAWSACLHIWYHEDDRDRSLVCARMELRADQKRVSGDVSCRIPLTPELSDHGPVGLEGAPAVRQATNLTISSRASTTRDQSCQPTGWKDRGRAVGDDRACGGGGVGGEALRRVRRGGGHPLSAFVTPDV